jgi:hypothetical protein
LVRTRAEKETISDGIDSETDTEHEAPDVNPTGEAFEEQERILPEIVERINELRELLDIQLEGIQRM